MKPRLTLNCVVVRSTRVMSAEVGDAVVLLDMEQSVYFDADRTGADVWRRLASPIRIGALVDALVQDYDVSRETCERDVLTFLQTAVDDNVVDVAPAPDAFAAR